MDEISFFAIRLCLTALPGIVPESHASLLSRPSCIASNLDHEKPDDRILELPFPYTDQPLCRGSILQSVT
jgi:hypothetical protein